ncbi:MAG: hypothetical protein JW889_00515 [Verrucomicrobia bacterium]|nr:hypothetical protein [Verrucomicrobiota bacterium]
MRDQVRKLIRSRDLYAFLTTLDVLQRRAVPLDDIVREAACALGEVLIQDEYPKAVPHGLMGLVGAWQATQYVPHEERLKPLAQALWYAATEKKHDPVRLDRIKASGYGSPSHRLRSFDHALERHHPRKAFSLFQGFVRNPKQRYIIRDRVLLEALDDTSHLGHKLISYAKVWQLALGLGFERTAPAFFPALHLTMLGAPEHDVSRHVRERLDGAKIDLKPFARQRGDLGPKEADAFETQILWDTDDAKLVETIAKLFAEGFGVRSILDAVLVAAARSVVNAEAERWMLAVHGFNYASECRFVTRSSRNPRRLMAAFMAALFVRRLARQSTKGGENRDPLAGTKLPGSTDPITTLNHAILISNPPEAARCVEAALDRGRADELYAQLVLTCAMNDGTQAFGHDIKMAANAIDAYTFSLSPNKTVLLEALAWFLATLTKGHTVHRELWA